MKRRKAAPKRSKPAEKAVYAPTEAVQSVPRTCASCGEPREGDAPHAPTDCITALQARIQALDVSAVVTQSIRITKAVLDRLESQLPSLMTLDTKGMQEFTGLLTKTQRTFAQMVKEARGIEKDAAAMVGRMKYDEKRSLLLDFIEHEMPLQHQRQLLKELAALVGKTK